MSGIYVHGCGAVSPAGWGVKQLYDAMDGGVGLPSKPLPRPGWATPLNIRPVPAPSPRPTFLSHARLRRASPISHYVVAAALEAIGSEASLAARGNFRLGVVLCVMSA